MNHWHIEQIVVPTLQAGIEVIPAWPMMLPTRRLTRCMLVMLLTAVAASTSASILGLWWALAQGLMSASIADAMILMVRQWADPALPGSPLGLWRLRKVITG